MPAPASLRPPSRFSRGTIFITMLAGITLAVGFLPNFPVSRLEPSPTPTLTIQNPRAAIQNPKIGLHTRLTDEPNPDNIKREFEMLRDMGASWATEFFPWPYIQPTDRNRFDWQHADQVVDAANAAGITLIARLDKVPAWARPSNTTWTYLDPDRYADYGNFVYAFVSHFKGRISYYIIWNEPNTAAEWGQRKPDPKAYSMLLQIAYKRAKEADPTSVVLLGGLAPNLEREGSPTALNDLTFLNKLYDEGAAPYFDAVAVHAYGLTASPDDPASPDKLNFTRAEETRKVMVARGDASKAVYITEGGWNDSSRWAYAVKPYQRVEYTIRAYQKAYEQWPWCRAVTLWASRLPKPAYNYFDNYTFLTPDFIPKALYLEVQKYAFGR